MKENCVTGWLFTKTKQKFYPNTVPIQHYLEVAECTHLKTIVNPENVQSM